MRQQLEADIGAATVEQGLAVLRSNPGLVGEVSLAWLATAYSDPAQRPIVEAALSGADKSLVLIETAAAMLVALYAIHALARIPKREWRTIERTVDGGYRETVQVDYESFSEPVQGLLAIVSAQAKLDTKTRW